MTRGAKLVLLTGGLTLGALVLGVVLRAPLLEVLLHFALATRQVPGVELTVEDVTLGETRITGLSLGASGEVQAAEIVATYDPRGLLAGRLHSLVLDGVSLKLDLGDDGPPLGSLQEAAIGSGSDSPATPVTSPGAIPRIILTNAWVEALTPLGPVSGGIEGELNPGEGDTLEAMLKFDLAGDFGRAQGHLDAVRGPGGKTLGNLTLADGALALPGAGLKGLRGEGTFRLQGLRPEAAALDFTLGEIALAGAAFEQARLSLRLDGSILETDTQLITPDGQFAATGQARFEGVPDRPEGEIKIEVDLGEGAVLWPLLALPAPSAGRAGVTVTASLRLPPLFDETAASVESWRPEVLSGDAKITLNGMAYSGLVQGLSGELRLKARPGPLLPDRLSADMDLDLAADSLTWNEFTASDVVFAQKTTLNVIEKKLSVTTNDIGIISLGHFKYASILKTEKVVAVGIEKASASVDLSAGAGLPITHDIALTPRGMDFILARKGAAPLAFRTRAGTLRALGEFTAQEGYYGTLTLAGGQAVLPAYDLAAEDMNATLALAPDGAIDLTFVIDALRHTAEPAIAAPVGLRGQAGQAGDVVTFSVTGNGPDGLGLVTASGRHRLSSGAGEAQIRLPPLVFSPGGAQPGTLIPALAELREVDGELRANAEMSWTREDIAGTAALTIDGLSFDSATARVEGLTLGLNLDRIWPPGSAPGQVVNLRRIDPGTPLDDLSVRFQILPRDPPALAIESAGFRLAGGRFALADIVVDPSIRQQHLPVKVEGLDLAEIFDLLGVEGLSGDGRLSGTLPIDVADGVPSIAGGLMKAERPGRLRIKSGAARQALAAAGESADLLLRALEDFYYEELTLTIDQPSENTAIVGLSLLGQNPAVLDGHPFRFNINLETDPGKLLDAFREAFLISTQTFRKVWIFGR